ncbi:sialin-like [Oppia nitens]|uniref:sialin-like n=1 Tax=Oppia nitens TaxID=1686743 RepID=UPI0023D9D77E|nr:sialin-like [Oppia nitens]
MSIRGEPMETDILLGYKTNGRTVRPLAPTKSPIFPSTRCYVAFISLMGTAIMYITRVNLNVAILAMVNTTQLTESVIPSTNWTNSIGLDVTVISDELQCPGSQLNSVSTNQQLDTMPSKPLMVSEFYWSPPEQGIVLGSFFYGYIWPQIFAGRLAELYGAKYLILLSTLVSAVINLLTPVIVRTNFVLFITSRVLLGVCQAMLYPAFYALFARWIPDEEHSTFMPWLDAGITIGTVIASAGAGKMLDENMLGGWPSIFYISGLLALVWCVVWWLTITSTPDQHRWISEKELAFITKHTSRESNTNETAAAKRSVPWKRIFMSSAFLSTLIAKVTYGITFDFMTSKMPAYLQDVIHFPIDQNGYTYAFIMVGFAITLLTCGFMADWLIKSTSLSKTMVRKIFQTISGVGMAASLILLPSVGCDKPLNITLLTICMLAYGFTSGGDVPIVPDMTEEFAGTVFAVMNTLCSFSGFVVPYFVGVLIDDNPYSMRLWSYSFYLSAIIDIVGTVVFVMYASAEPQHWEVESYSVLENETPVVVTTTKETFSLKDNKLKNNNKNNYNSKLLQ